MSNYQGHNAPTRREFLAAASLAPIAGWLRGEPAPGQSQQPTATAFKEIRGGVGFFIGRGGTIGWCIAASTAAVVDSQFPDTARICLERLNQRSAGLPIEALMITHHHGDHTGGNGVFRPAVRKIVAHENVPGLQKKAAAQQKNEDQQTYPDTTFSDAWTGDLGKEKVHMVHHGPAHTGGDATVHFEQANVVHMGDLVFNRRHPYIDLPAGASIAGWGRVLEKIAARHTQETLFIFGHAGPGFDVIGGASDLLYQRDYFSALLDHVRGEIKAGKSREAIVGSTEPLKGFADHGPLIERVVQAAYEELTA